MPHDFAKQREVRAHRAANRPVAPWLWFCSGAIIGGFCSFLLFLAIGAPQATRPDPSSTANAPAPPQVPPEGPAAKPQFDFYTLLPESEVIVGTRSGAGGNGNASPAAGADPAVSVLLLQAGSFRQQSEADRRRADIVLLGYEARVEMVSVGNENTWYRVLVGPFPGAEQLAGARHTLLEQGFDTLEIGKRAP